MVGTRVGALVMATMSVVFLLNGVIFVGQGRVPLGALALLAAAACASFVVRVYARAAAMRRSRARAREQAFVDSVRRG